MPLNAVLLVPGDGLASIVTDAGVERESIRVVRRFDDFAGALAAQTRLSVRVYDGSDVPVAPETAILICRPDVLDRLLPRGAEDALIAERVVLIDVVRTAALECAERLGLAAAVETGEYLAWQNAHLPREPAAVYGRKNVGARMGASWPEGGPFETEHFARLSRQDLPDLPALLGAYLDEYARQF
jgi:hypothetical protein